MSSRLRKWLMATHPPPQGLVSVQQERGFGQARVFLLLGLLALLALCLIFSWMTRDAMAHLSFLKGRGQAHGVATGQNNIVDLSPWQTAQALSPLAVSSEEVQFAREAERLADHEVDQAFAAALRQATTHHAAPTGEAVGISQRVARLQQVVKADQALVDSLSGGAKSAPAAATSGTSAPAQTADLEIAKAQLGLDSDQLADAQNDLARATGDQRTKVQQELAAHEASMQKYDQSRDQGQIAVLSVGQYATLAGRIRAWLRQRSRQQLIQQAQEQTQADVAALNAEHNTLEARAEHAASSSSGQQSIGAARLADIQRRSEMNQVIGIYDDRIQTEQQLVAVYGKWSAQVLLQHRIVLHLIMQSLAWIAVILICVILCEWLVTHLLDQPALDRRRMHTLRMILTLSVQTLGAVLVLMVVFGVPSQTSTILGLATAGLTVALQDFIVAFMGWFVLMGKNGIRVGDWVEINGVGGEVVEIGLIRTTVLETGNWTDIGHPTGRRVTFLNSYAIRGQFFNFSTSGQWMWDEISISAPASADLYVMADGIREAVVQETAKDTALAEQEWKRTTRQIGLNHFTVSPAVSLRPSGSSIDILVRYITRASNRFDVRNRLYGKVMNVLHKPEALPIPALDEQFSVEPSHS